MNLKKSLILISIIFGTLVILTTLFFIYNFSNQSISDNISNWSDFGSFYWGFLSLIVTIINLIVFIILTVNVSKIQDNWNNFNVLFEQKKLLTDYRHKAIEELSRITNSYLIKIANKAFEKEFTDLNYVYFETINLEESIKSYLTIYSYFFEDLPEKAQKILDLAEKLKENMNRKDKFNDKEFSSDLKIYRKLVNITVSKLQEYNMSKFIN